MPAKPVRYSPEIIEEICQRIAQGGSLNRICAENAHLPAQFTFHRWLAVHEHARVRYAQARELQAEAFVDDIVDIADRCADPNKARVQIDARKWVASKLAPKKYGDRLDIGSDGSPVRLVCEWNGQRNTADQNGQAELDEPARLPPPSKKDDV